MMALAPTLVTSSAISREPEAARPHPTVMDGSGRGAFPGSGGAPEQVDRGHEPGGGDAAEVRIAIRAIVDPVLTAEERKALDKVATDRDA